MKKISEISELIYEAQDPIDETRNLDEIYGLDETNNATYEEETFETFYTNREMYLAMAKDFVKDLPYVIIGAACCLSTFIATDCLLLGSGKLANLNNINYSIQKEKTAICDTVIAPLQKNAKRK